jgi:hypothetical protein
VARFLTNKPATVAVIGGGVAGSTIAIRLALAGLNVHVFEKNASPINAPPMCHLHAGGNLYRDISIDDCKTLLRQSIDIAKLYPDSIDVRPTVITVPTRDSGTARELLPRLKILTEYYRQLIAHDPSNQVLGAPDDYYRLYEKADLERLAQLPDVAKPQSIEEWLIPVAKLVDLTQVQWPVIAVQEYGWNIFRLAASALLQLQQLPNVQLHFHTNVDTLTRQGDDLHPQWLIHYQASDAPSLTFETASEPLLADFVVNASGFRTGMIDDQVGVKIARMVEFKASYLCQWQGYQGQLPEVIFHGERGTPHGMAQFTPYAGNVFQLHGMTDQITLFRDGLTRANDDSSQPPVLPQYLRYIEQGWDTKRLAQRTQSAIDYVSDFIPPFADTTPIDKALYGAQQVPDDDISRRVADLQVFPELNYAVAENVKANSALDVADNVVTALVCNHLLPKSQSQRPHWPRLDVTQVDDLATALAQQRGYPLAMAKVNNPLQLLSSANAAQA